MTKEEFDGVVKDLYYELLSNIDARFNYMSEKRNCLSELVEMLDHENGDYFDDLARTRETRSKPRARYPEPEKKGAK